MNSIVAESPAWRAAHERAVIIQRTDLAIVRVFGRDPVRMVQGLLTNDVAALPVGGATYAALLTPKGRMLADLRVIRRAGDVLLICDAAATTNVRDTLRKYVPPLFARSENVTDLRILGVYGPQATRVVTASLDPLTGPADLGSAVGPEPQATEADRPAATGTAAGLAGVPEDGGLAATIAGSDVYVVKDLDGGVSGWLIIGSPDTIAAAESNFGSVTEPADALTFETLRIEAGRPRWGAELTEEVIPIEAGITSRAISTGKGCYTGQEVIIRILHRGHVNWRLMGFRLGDVEPPPPGTQAFRPGEARAVARLTSACRSPALRGTVAMGYVRREIESGTVLRWGSPDGPDALVTDLPFVN